MVWTKQGRNYIQKPAKAEKYPIPIERNRLVLEGELKEKFIELYTKNTNRRICKWFGISKASCYRLGKKLGLKKDMVAILKQSGSDVKKANTENGYYDTLRGKPMSDACREAYRKKLDAGYKPFVHFKETNPEGFVKAIKKRSDTRRKIVKAEKARLLYGLPQRTNIKVSLRKYTATDYAIRNRMIRVCNYFADPDCFGVILYDSQTKRSMKREATAARHGFKVMPADEEEKQTIQQAAP